MFGCIMGDGEWRPEVLNEVVEAHAGPVFDIRHDQYTLLVASCGGDGLVKTWKLRTRLNPTDKSKTEIALIQHEAIPIFEIVEELPVHVTDATFGKSLLLHKTASGPRLLIGTNTGEVLSLSLNTESKIPKDEITHHPLPATLLIAGQGGSVTDMVTHPTKSLALSTGRDCAVKLWDLGNKRLAAVKGFKWPVVSVDFVSGEQMVVAVADGTIILLHAGWTKAEDGGGEDDRWILTELSREKCCRTPGMNESGHVEPTVIRASSELVGEQFLAVGRSDGLIDFFAIEQAKATGDAGMEARPVLTPLATTGADGMRRWRRVCACTIS